MKTTTTGESLGKQSLKGVAWTFGALVANQIMNLTSMAVLARKLTPYEFGIIGAAMLFIEFTNILNNLGIATSLVQKKEVTKQHEYTAFTFSIAIGVFLYILIFGLSWPAAEFFKIKELGPVLRVLSVTLIITSFGSVPKALLSRKMQFKYLARNNSFSQFFGWTVVSITMALLGFGYWSIVGGRIANALVGVTGLMIKAPHSKKIAIHKKSFKDIFGMGAGITTQNIILYFAQQSDTIIVGRVLGATALGIYNRAYSLMALLANFLGNSLSGVLVSSTAKITQDIQRLQSAFDKLVKVSSLVLLPITTLVMVLTPEIINLILGDQWGKTILLFQILAVGTFFRFGYRIGTSMTVAMGKIKEVVIRQIIYLVVVIVSVLIGLKYDLAGVATGVLVSLFINYLICSFQIMNIVQYSKGVFIKAHLTGFKVSALVFTLSYPSAMLFRNTLKAPYLLTLAGSGLITVAGLALLYFLYPSFYGKENIAMLKNLKMGKGRKQTKEKKSTGVKVDESLPEEDFVNN